MRAEVRHWGAPLLVVAALAVTMGACGGDDSTPAQGGAGSSGSSGSAGSAGSATTGTYGFFELPADPASLDGGCSVDGLIYEGEDGCPSNFFDHPWPSDFRRTSDGKLAIAGYPNPKKLPIITDYIQVATKVLAGFSPQGAGFMRFSGPLDTSSLPADSAASEKAGASVQLVVVDDASPARGTRHPIELHFREPEGAYWSPNTLAYRPRYGFPLLPKTRYAWVVTTAVKDKSGSAIVPSENLKKVLGTSASDASSSALAAAWKPDIEYLATQGIATADIANLAVFTTDDPTAELVAIQKDVRANEQPPKVLENSWKTGDQNSDYDTYEGDFGPTPDYQKGTLPFTNSGDGGEFAFENGVPKVQRRFDMRFALTVPNATACPMPANGYPIVLYAHGTTGSYRSFIGNGSARALAKQCMATMGVDQIFHGTRPGAPQGPNADAEIQLLFFNFRNPDAGRTNGRQSAVDEVQRARLFTETKQEVPANISQTGAAIKFDPTKVLFYGHSQGGLNGPLYLAIDDSARGGVLSGSGSIISITLLEKTKPSPSVAGVVRTLFLGLTPTEYEELNEYHPAISLAQSLVDPIDPIHYVRHIFQSPLGNNAPKSILMTEGVNADGTGDNYTPPRSTEAQAVAMGLPLMTPVIRPIPEMQHAAGEVTIPASGLTGNLASGKASGVLAQWPATAASDGHFVLFQAPGAEEQAAGFCRNLAHDPIGNVPAP